MTEAKTSGAALEDIAGLLRSAAAVTSEATDVDAALGWILALVCELTGWPVGHLYAVDERSGQAVPGDLWHLDDPTRYTAFVDATGRHPLAEGEGLPGRVLATGEPLWIPDVRSDPDFPRRDAATECGLGAGVGIPICTSRGVEGVMEFFAAELVEPDERLLDLVAHVGVQLGNLYDRHRADEQLRASEATLAAAERLALLGSWSWHVDDRATTWSAGVYRILGLDALGEPLTLDEYLARVHPDDRVRVGAAVQRTVETGRPFEDEYRVIRPDGDVRWVLARGEAATAADGTVSRLDGFCQDITERKADEERRRRAQELLERHQSILEGIARGRSMVSTLTALCRDIEDQYGGVRASVLLADPVERVLRHAAAPSLDRSFQWAVDGLPIAVGMGVCGTAAARNEVVIVEDALTDPLTAAFTDLSIEHDLRSAWSHPVRDATGGLLGIFAVYRRVPHRPTDAEIRSVAVAGNLAALAIERDRAEKALMAAAHIDPVTGLPNRAHFLDEVTAHLATADGRIAVMFLDLDRFKWINDSLGHPAGDTILVEVAARLRSVLRSRDVLARFGGDEFTILVTDATDDSVEAIASRVEAEFTEPFRLDGGEFFLSVSAGIAIADGTSNAYDLVRDADAAMYAAKESGRACHAIFDEGLRERAVARVTLETELRRAIDRDEFALDFQPMRDLSTGTWRGVEALARWHHPTRGVLAPEAFIPLAEETGLIVPLGLRLLDRVAAQAKAWMAMGIEIRVAANISAVQLADPNIASVIAAVLQHHALVPSALVFEVTETTLMERVDTVQEVMVELAAMDVRVVIDDFGTGYSSIARLTELPVTGVKIDKRFTRDLGVDPGAAKVLGAITALAHSLGLRVVAEGIETEVALQAAIDLGCEFVQGFHLAPPAPADEITKLLTP